MGSSFDYPHTCPAIDHGLAWMRKEIEETLTSLVDDDLFQDLSYHLNINISPIFEQVRSTNSDMRKSAEYQINGLETEVRNHLDTISNLEAKIREYEDKIDDLNFSIENYENIISDLKKGSLNLEDV